jgi:hypothetical protein
MINFKFFQDNIPDEPEHIEDYYPIPNTIEGHLNARYVYQHQNNLYTANRYFRSTVARDEWQLEDYWQLLRQERNRFIEDLWRSEYIKQDLIFDDITGFTVRTEFRH